MWHDSFILTTWLIIYVWRMICWMYCLRKCDLTPSTCGTWLVYHGRHDSYRVTSNMTDLCLGHDSYICVCDMTHTSDMILYCITVQHTATHCNTLQHTATHRNTMQHAAAHCNTLQHAATHCNTLQHTAIHCNTLQHTATHCNTLQHSATHYNTLQHTATHCDTLQHTATHCNTRATHSDMGWLPFYRTLL